MLVILERLLPNRVFNISRLYSTAITNNLPLETDYNPVPHNLNAPNDVQVEKSLNIAILGLPNAGKSTLINEIVRRPLCAASKKAQTTRSKSDVIYTEGNTQLVFIDTPGIVPNREIKKFALESSFTKDVNTSLCRADCIGLIQDVSAMKKAKISGLVCESFDFAKTDVKKLLILNKIDKIGKKSQLLEIISRIQSREDYPKFDDIFMISALKNDGVDDFRTYLINAAEHREWNYKSDEHCSDSYEVLIQRAVRSKFMDELPKEIPYQLTIKLEHFELLADDSISAFVTVKSKSDRILSLVMGMKGMRLRKVALESEQELSSAFRKTVRLKVGVEFRDNDKAIKERIKEMRGKRTAKATNIQFNDFRMIVEEKE